MTICLCHALQGNFQRSAFSAMFDDDFRHSPSRIAMNHDVGGPRHTHIKDTNKHLPTSMLHRGNPGLFLDFDDSSEKLNNGEEASENPPAPLSFSNLPSPQPPNLATSSARPTTHKNCDDAQRSTEATLKVENRNLRMKLMYMEELMTKRNIQHTLVDEVTSLQNQVEALKREVVEARKHCSRLSVDNEGMTIRLDELQSKEGMWEADRLRLAVIPDLQTTIHKLELERDDATTKVLSLQCELHAERQIRDTSTRALTQERDALIAQQEKCSASKDEQIMTERSLHEGSIRRLTHDFESIKADLRLMVEEKSDALIKAERECDSLRGVVSSLEIELAQLRRTLTDRSVALEEAKQSIEEALITQRKSEMESQDVLFAKDKKLASAEARLSELENLQVSNEEMLSTYKEFFERALGSLKYTGHGGLPGVSDPADRQETIPGSAPSLMRAVLKSTLEDAMLTHRQERQREVHSAMDSIQRLFGATMISGEETHTTAHLKLRRCFGRLGELCDLAELCLRRKRKQDGFVSEQMSRLRDEARASKEALLQSHMKIQDLSNQNVSLMDELRRITAERECERNAAMIMTSFDNATVSIQASIAQAAKEIRESVVPNTVITPEFIDSIQRLTRRCHQVVDEVHDVIHVAQRQYHAYVLSPSTHQLPSPSKAFTIEQLVNQLNNVCVLLENNATQTQQSARKLQEGLDMWTGDLKAQWSLIEEKLAALIQRSNGARSSTTARHPAPLQAPPQYPSVTLHYTTPQQKLL